MVSQKRQLGLAPVPMGAYTYKGCYCNVGLRVLMYGTHSNHIFNIHMAYYIGQREIKVKDAPGALCTTVHVQY